MKSGKIELYGKDKMQNIIKEIKNILLEKNVNTSAKSRLENISSEISGDVKDQDLKAKAKSRNSNSDVEEDEDIMSKSKKDLASKDDDSDDDSDDEKVETPDESPSTINLADASSFENLIDTLNQFRAAHSFTDDEVSSRLKDYFNSLEREEKEVLHILVKGLIQITVLDVSGKDAYTPSKLMFKINKTGSASSERKKSIKRKIDAEVGQDKTTSIDKKTSGGLPITTIGAGVSESYTSKRELISIVKRNNV